MRAYVDCHVLSVSVFSFFAAHRGLCNVWRTFVFYIFVWFFFPPLITLLIFLPTHPLIPSSLPAMEQYVASLEQTLQQVLFSNDSNQIKEVRPGFPADRPWTHSLPSVATILKDLLRFENGKLIITNSLACEHVGNQGSEQPVLCRCQLCPCSRSYYSDFAPEGGKQPSCHSVR